MTPGTPATDFTTTLRALAAVQAELTTVADDDIDRRQALQAREEALRTDLRSFSAPGTDEESIDQLKRSIAEAERRIEDHYGNRLSHTSGAQTGYGGGLDPKYLHQMNRAMDSANDLAGMKAELSRLKHKLNTLESG